MSVTNDSSRTHRLTELSTRCVSLHAACLYVQCLFRLRRILPALKITERCEQLICIKLCLKHKTSSTETIEMIRTTFVDKCINKTQIKEWWKRFKDDRASVCSNQRSRRPNTITLKNIEHVRLAIAEDRRLAVRETESDVGIPKTSVSRIPTTN